MGKNPQASRLKKSKFKDKDHCEDLEADLLEEAAKQGMSLLEYQQSLQEEEEEEKEDGEEASDTLED